MKNQELDISWFKLKNYESPDSLDLEWWFSQLMIRKINLRHGGTAVRRVKEMPIFPKSVIKKWKWRDGNSYDFDTYSVQSTTVLELSEILNQKSLNDVWELPKNYSTADESQLKTIHSAINVLCKERGIYQGKLHQVSIDLTASDEQIKSDFERWLKKYRKFYYPKKHKIKIAENFRNFTISDMEEWNDLRVLQYIDLTQVAEFEGKEIPDAKIEKTLSKDGTDFKVAKTKKKANWLLDPATINAIDAQILANS